MPRTTAARRLLRRTVIVATLLGFALTPCVAHAADLPKALKDRVKTDFDKQAVDSLDFLLTLELTADQARAVLPIFEKACRLHTEYYENKGEIQPAEIEAYGAFLEEDRLNQGFSPEVEKHTAQVHRRAIAAREELAAHLNDLSEQVWDLLTAKRSSGTSPGGRPSSTNSPPATRNSAPPATAPAGAIRGSRATIGGTAPWTTSAASVGRSSKRSTSGPAPSPGTC